MADKLDGAAIVANSLPATAIVAGSITTTQLAPSVANVVTVGSNPKIASLTYPGDDTAANTGGDQTVVINGSGFKSNVSVYINGNAVPSVTYTNANSISITTPALAAATYPLYVINTDDGGTAILIPGIQYSGTPSWVTTSPLDGQQALASWSISLSATSDSSVTYSLQAGSSLPTGISLAANGLISGTMSSPPENDTTYNFTVVATDAEFQDASKAFSVSVTVVVDTQFQYTTLLLQADGTNNGNNHAFLDSSNNNFAITRNGNATQGSFTPFSPTGWSNHFDGSGDYLQLSYNSNFTFGSGNFTIEMWVYSQRAAGTAYPLTGIWDDNSTNPQSWILYVLSSGQAQFLVDLAGSDTPVITSANALPINQWVHVAVVRNGNVWTMYFNGISVASATQSYTISAGSAWLGVGSYQTNNGIQYSGYISNFRIVKGTAVYTSEFTPPTSPLTVISGTSVLTCQSNRFRDTSANAYGITAAGNVSVQTFSPFATTTAYSPATHGGSIYVDGTGDYLTLPSNTALDASTTWCAECWVYPTYSSGNDKTIFGHLNTISYPTNYPGWDFLAATPTTVAFRWGYPNYTDSGSFAYSIYAWNHLAVSISGGRLSFFVNGTRVYTTTTNTTISASGGSKYIGYSGTNSPFLGYISGARLVKGSTPYDPTSSTITVPTSPPSNIANTQLLCNFTNAQIYDAAAGVVLECVGDAKVNTAIKKYGAGSIAFDGTGDYLRSPYSHNLQMGTSDFTVEAWVYLPSAPVDYGLIFNIRNSTAQYSPLQVYIRNSGIVDCYFSTNGSTNSNLASTGTVPLTTWTHVAVVRASGVVKIYINGTLASGTLSLSGSLYLDTSWVSNIGGEPGGNPFIGYIDDLRISKGLARYRYNFTPPTRAFATKGGTQTLTADEDFEYTTLLLPGNGTNNQNNHTFLDSSNNNFTITRNGNATQGTFSPFSQTGWSNYFDGSSGYLRNTSTSITDFGTGNFTAEVWVYKVTSAAGFVYDGRSTGGNGPNFQIYFDANNKVITVFNGSTVFTSTIAVPLNQWTHVVICRGGTGSNQAAVFINGVRSDLVTLSGTYTNGDNIIGAASYTPLGAAVFPGYISNFRIVKGVDVYGYTNSSITVPTAPLTAINGTSLLTCQSNRFVDNSNNNYSLSVSGSPSIQAFSPFAPTASYASANVGGSGYFDGSGDYLVSSSNTALQQGTGDYTYECWVYHTNTSGQQTYFARSTAGNYNGVYFYKDTSNNVGVYYTTQIATGNVTIVSGQWYHLAAARSSGRLRLFVNGVLAANVADTTNLTESVVVIGADANGSSPFNGYISGARVLKSNGLYTAAFTPPTAPLTNVANTSLLCNFTNAGITDATAKNVLETVGDAKISTAQSKFGGSSIVFDGSGDRLTIPFTSDLLELGIGGQNFTVEAWIYPTNAMASAGQILSKGGGVASWSTTNGAQYQWTIYNSAASWNFNSSGNSITVNSGTVTLNTWQHLAVTYDGTTTRTFLNGILQSTSTSSYTAPSTRNLQYIGMTQSGGYTQEYYGYINDLRITKGIARYTQNFALPTTAFLTK